MKTYYRFLFLCLFVFLSISGFTQPVISVSPSSLNVSLNHCNDSTVRQVIISNTGNADLIYSTSVVNTFGGHPFNIALLGAEGSGYIDDVYAKMVATGRFNSVTMINVRYTTPTLTELLNFDAVMVWSDWDYYEPEALGNVLADYVDQGGGVVCALFETGGWDGGYLMGRWALEGYNVITRNGYQYGWITLGTVALPTHPLWNNVLTFDGGSYCYRPSSYTLMPNSVLVASWSDGAPLVATKKIGKKNRVDLGFWPVSTGYNVNGWNQTTDGDVIMANALEYVIKSPWLSVISNAYDTVSPGNSVTVNLKIKTNELSVGDYLSYFVVLSNDPVHSSDTVPCYLHLEGEPYLHINDSCIYFDTTYITGHQTKTFSLFNYGCDTLLVSNINATSPFSVTPNNLVIPPFQSDSVYVTFSPVQVSMATGMLHIHSNSHDTTVCLNGVGKSTNIIIQAAPDSINVTLIDCNDSIMVPIEITNAGTADLNYNIETSGGSTPSEYCTPIYTYCCPAGCGDDDAINNFSFHTISNLNSGCNGQANGYIYYPDMVTTVIPGNTYNISMQSSYYSEGFGVWIDYNQDGDYDDAGEFVYGSPTYGADVFSGTVTIPSQATRGRTRMRVRCAYHTVFNASNYCTSFTYGETEEYDVIIGSIFITASPILDTVTPGNSSIVNVKIKSEGLLSGIHHANILIHSNSPANPTLTIPCTLYLIGVPDISVSQNCLKYDSVFQFGTRTDSIIINNNGCGYLNITNITHANTSFQPSFTTLSIPPQSKDTLLVTFSPLTVGNFLDTLHIFNNDSTIAVCLHGYALSPPVINVSPNSINATLGCCDSVTQVLTIQNTGTYNLSCNLICKNKYYAILDGNDDYINLNYSFPNLNTVTAEAWIYPTNITGNHYILSNGRDCCAPTGGFNFFISNNSLCGQIWRSAGGNLISTSSTGVITLNEWQHVAMTYDGSVIKLYRNGVLVSTSPTYSASSILNGSNTLYAGILAYNVPQNYEFEGRIDEIKVWNNVRTQSQIYSGMKMLSGGVEPGLAGYWNFEKQNVMDATLFAHNGTLYGNTAIMAYPSSGSCFQNDWLTVSPDSATVSPGNNALINVKYKSCGLSAGTYSTHILISSNDPLHPLDTVPCTHTVIGSPDIHSSETCLAFDTIMQYTVKTDTITLSNTGCDTLKITNISHALTAFTLSSTSINILPYSSQNILVTFKPLTAGHFYDTLHILNNDSNIAVCLHGYAFSAPVIIVSPDSMNITLGCCDSATQVLTIQNTGTYNLSCNLICENKYYATLDGNDDYINLNYSFPNLNTVTLEAWIYPTNISGTHYILSNGRDCCTPTGGFNFFISNNSLCGQIWRSAGGNLISTSSTGVITLNEWQHVAMTYDGSVIKLYRNGVLVSTSPTYSASSILNGSNTLYAGILAFSVPTYYEFAGRIDEIKIWNNVRPQSQIYSGMKMLSGGVEPGLAGYWNFEKQNVNDVTSFSHNGTLYGNTVITAYPSSGSCFQNDWLTVSPDSATVSLGNNALINVKYKSCGLSTGTYSTHILISSNDPLHPLDTVPCTLTVIGSPNIHSSETCLAFDTIMQYTVKTDTVTISNTGCDTLKITNISHSLSAYMLSSTSINILPYGSQNILVTFKPLTAGHFYDTLHIINNDSNITVCLHGYAFSPPEVSVIPDSINITTSMCNDSLNVPIIISNTGDTLLMWNLNIPERNTAMLRFDGSNDEVDIGTWFNYQTFTIEMWVKAGTWQNQYADIFDNNHSDYRSFVLQQNSTTLNQYSLGMCDGGNNNGFLFNLTAGQWTHIAVTRDQVTRVRKFYINGSLYASSTGTHDITYDGSQFLRLCRWGGGGRYWNGDMDEVRIWNTVRTQQEISDNMNTPLIGFEPNLVGYWNFNEGTGSLANDISGNGHNSPVSGATWAVSDAPIVALMEADTLSGITASGTSDTVNISLNSNVLIPGTYSSYIIINSNDPLHSSDSIPYTVIINDKPPAPVTSDVSICNGEPVPDLIAMGSNIIWYNDTGIVHLGNVFSTGETAIGIYHYYVTQTIDSCEGYSDTVTLTINAIPSAPVATDVVVCNNAPVPNLAATGLNIKWYSDAALTDLIYSGNNYATGITSVGTYMYYVTQTINGCTSPSDAVTLTINSSPLPPTTSDTTICFGQPTPNLFVHGDSIRWYSDSLLTILIHTGDTLVPGVSFHGVYHYYVTQTNAGYNCQGHPSTLTLTIDSLPNKPVATNQSICFGEPTPNMAATGDSIRWYTDATLTQLVHAGNTYNSGETNVGVYVYYIIQTNQCGESAYTTDTLTINTIPAPPVGVNQSVCFGTTNVTLTCAGSGITWYSDTMLTVIAGIGNNYPVGVTSVGIHHYYITQTINGCESSSDTVTYEIRPIPVTPVSQDTAICFGMTTPVLSATGNNLEWYSDAALTVLINTGNTYLSPETTVGTYTYYIIDVDNVAYCSSFVDSVKLTINPIPLAPIAADKTICFEQPTPNLTATGNNVIWYDDPTLNHVIQTGNTYITGITAVGTYTYYLTQTNNGCTSLSDTVTLTINPIPLPPVTFDTTICSGESTPNLFVHGDSIRWYSDSQLTHLIHTGDTLVPGVSLQGVYHYYVTQTNAGYNCQGHASTITLTIDSLLPKPTSTNQFVCQGQATPALVASGDSIRWYADALLTQFLYSGNNFTSPQTVSGIYTYYFTSNNHCGESTPDSVTLTIYSVPIAPVALDTSSCFGSPVPTLWATGSGIRWYSDPTLLTLVGNNNTLITGMTAPGIYHFYATQTSNSCESPADSATLTIYALPPQPVGTDEMMCVNEPVPFLTASGTNISWYSDATLDTLIQTGNSYHPLVDSTIAEIYYYYITQTDLVSSCTSLPDTVILEIDAPLAAPVANNLYMCEGAGPAILTATGVNVTWYDDAILTHLVYSGNTFPTGITSPGNYTFFVIQTNSCGNSISDTVILIINHLPVTPVTNDVSVCYGNPVPSLSATGNNVKWFSDSTLTTLLYSGNIFAPPVTLPGVYIYYAADLDIITGCYSHPAKATLTIKALPLPPTTSDTSTCFGNAVPELIAFGNNIQWYSDPQLLNYIDSGNTLNTGQTAAGIYTYYATQTNDCGQGPAANATLYIYANPVAPTASNASICYGEPAPTLTATGINIIWYSNASLTTVIAMGNNYVPSDTAAGTYTYYITQTDSFTGCTSTSSSVVYTIYNSAMPPVVTNATCCIGNPVPTLYATGTNITWYSDPTLTNPVQWGNSYTPPVSSVGIYTYYVTQGTALCGTSTDAIVTLTINSIPSPPLTNDISVCSNEPIPALTASGNNINWYSESNLILLVHTGNTYNTGNTEAGTYTYYVTQTVDGCSSVASKIVQNIYPSPLVTLNHYNVSIAEGESVTLIAYNALTYTWTPLEGLNTTIGAIVIASPDTTTMYMVTGISANGCSDTASCLVNVSTNVFNNTVTSYLAVYPNPTNGKLIIKYKSAGQEKIKIRLMDMLSKSLVVRNAETVNGMVELTIDLGMYANGIYNLQVETEKHVYNQKIVLKHSIY